MQIIDADGHINDHACGDEIATYMPEGNQMAKLFPEFRPSTLSLSQAKPAQYGQSNTGRLDEFPRQDRHQLDGALPYRWISGGAHHGGGVGHCRLQSV